MLVTPVPPTALTLPRRSLSSLLERLIAHDEEAFAQLVEVHGPRLLAVASRYLKCRADAEDAVQDAFVNVIRSIGTFNGSSTLETWLHRIVVNCSLMILRSRRRKPLLTNADGQMTGGVASPVRRGDSELPGHRLVAAERTRELGAAVHALPAVQRSVIQFRYDGGLQVQAIADLLATSVSTVKTRLHRARHALQGALVPQGL